MITVTINDVDYQWGETTRSCTLSSREYGIKSGDVRMIRGVLFYVSYIYKRYFSKSNITWIPVEDTINRKDVDKIRSKVLSYGIREDYYST